MSQKNVRLGDIVGNDLEENFSDFDLTEIQEVLDSLKYTEAIDLAHAELLQQQALRAADIIAEHLSKLVKTVSYLEVKANSIKNKVSLNYQSPEGKTTADAKKQAGESSDEYLNIHENLSRAKGSKLLLEKKYDILIRTHHQYKEIAGGLRKGIVGMNYYNSEKAEGY